MWPTAKIARAIVGEPPESSHLQVDLRGGVEVQPPQRRGEDHRRDQRPPTARAGGVAVDRALPGRDDHLAEQDDQEQPEALGEVVCVQRLGRVGGLQRREVVVAARLLRRLAVLVERRAGLDDDGDRPQRVAPRFRDRGREREEPGRDDVRAGDPLPQRFAPVAVDRLRDGQHQPHGGEAQREYRAVTGRRRVDRDRRDPRRHTGGQEQQPLRGSIGAVPVVEHGEADPRPPQREEQAEHDPNSAHDRLGHDQVRELADGQNEDQVDVELDERDTFAGRGHARILPQSLDPA
jgi:hypothetical protein